MNPPAFQFYTDDFLGGTSHFSDAEVGLYLRLLLAQWSKGSLPDDDKELRSYSKGKTPLDRVKQKFDKGDDGRLRNARLEEEREKQRLFREKQSSKANARWNPKSCHGNATAMPRDDSGIAPASSGHMPNGCSPLSDLRTPHTKRVCEHLPELRKSLCVAFEKPENERWGYEEERLLVEVASDPQCLSQMALLNRYRKGLPESDRRKFPWSIRALLDKWNQTLDAARNFKEPSVL